MAISRACRIFPIFAREAKSVLLFRRGPSKWTELVLWDTCCDKLTFGQWFFGNIYPRRADLSPDGTTLIYFATKFSKQNPHYKHPICCWTAVSRPPYFTALVLWPAEYFSYEVSEGGGLFESNHSIMLNHRPGYSVPLEGHLPEDMKVSLIPEANGWDEPIFSVRLERDGWVLHQAATKRQVNPRYWVIEKPEIRIRTDPSNKYKIWMIRKPGYRDESFRIKDIEGTDVLNLNARSWADWDQNGRLVLISGGRLLIGEPNSDESSFSVKELADLNTRTPQNVVAPEWAITW